MSLPVRSGFCSLPESANSFSMIFWVSTNQLWSWPVETMCSSVPRVSKPGNSGTGRRLPVASSQRRRRAGQDADAVARPHRRVVLDALDVVPHAVAVDEARAGLLADAEHPPVDVRGNAGEHVLRRGAQPLRPVLAHEVVVAADAAARDDDRAGAELEVADHVAVARGAARCVIVGAGSRRARRRPRRSRRSARRPGAGRRSVDEAALDADRAPSAMNGSRMPGPVPHDDVEARHRVAVARRGVAAALGPADDGEELHAHAAQPVALLVRRRSAGRPRPTAAPSRLRRGRSPRCRTSPGGRARGSPSRPCGAAPGSRSGTARRTTTRPARRSWRRGSCSTMVTRLPASTSSAAATSPARPAPTTIASACGGRSALGTGVVAVALARHPETPSSRVRRASDSGGLARSESPAKTTAAGCTAS